MKGVVRKSSPVVVRPSTPVMKTGSINLSSFDKGLDTMPATFFFVFDHPIHKPAETIKRVLSEALVHYYPIAGRLAIRPEDGMLCIQCTGDGVVFVAASADCTLKEAEFFFDRSLGETTIMLKEFATAYPAENCSLTDALLQMQVTEFSCGGYVIGVTWNHAIADAFGMGQFLQAVGELARGSPAPTVVPVRYDDSLPGLPPVATTEQESMMSHELPDLVFLEITIPSSFINQIRAKLCSHSDDQQPCTVFEAVTAVLWQCRTRATMTVPEAPTVLFFTANARKHAGAKDGYYGNCVSQHSIMATSGLVANGELMDIVKMIRRAKEQIPDNRLKDKERSGEMEQAGQEKNVDMLQHSYNHLGVSCMRNLGLDKADFGGGTPARVMCHVPRMPLPMCAACLPCQGKDGANVLTRCVKQEHAGAFLAELERFTA